jgi:multidrug efflux pump subunit AcrB
MFDGFLEGIPEVQHFLERLQTILGGHVGEGSFEVNINFSWDNPKEAKKTRVRIQELEVQLRHLRSDVVHAVQRLNADFDRLKAELTGMPAQKAFVRQKQLEGRQGYNELKQGIDNILLQLNKGKVEIDNELS